MILFFYNLALLAALVLGAPWWLFRIAFTPRYRAGLLQRLGQVPVRLSQSQRPAIWLHAVSVGEVLAVSTLVAQIDRALPDHQLFISTTTLTGQELARQRFGTDRVFYCPLDLPWAVRAYLNALRPRLFILAETEFWPNLLTACFRRQIPVAVVNARISDRSWPRYLRLRRLWQPILSRLDRVLAQTETDAARLRAIGCVPHRVDVAGNLKFDVRADSDTAATRLLKNLTHDLKLLVAGSTLEGEEAALLHAWPALCAADSRRVLVLAPRHPARFPSVEQLLARSGLKYVTRSHLRGASQGPLNGGEVILLDTIGELASIYSLATIAFIGGSLVRAGGHNPLEPAQFGVPIVMGPHYANFRAITEELVAEDGLRIAAQEELTVALFELFENPLEAAAMGERARRVFDRQTGPTSHCLQALLQLLPPNGVQEDFRGVRQ